MSFFSRFGKSHSVPPSATFTLTQSGRHKVQEFGGDPKSRVLTALETRGTSDIDEISAASGLNRGQVENLVPSLVRAGYIQYVNSSMSVEE